MDYPLHFKRDAAGEVVTGIGELYRNDSVPWEGSIIDYANDVAQNVKIDFTWASDGARENYPSSKWTAAVADVANGVVDVGFSDFWVTFARSKMTNFAVPFDIDLHYLWVPRPSFDNSLGTTMLKVFHPMTLQSWMMLVVLILTVSSFEVWLFREDWRDDGFDDWANANGFLAKTWVILVQCAARFGKTGMHILAGFPDIPQKTSQLILWIGWALFILIFLTAYTANLAAFLGKSDVGDYYSSMSDVTKSGGIVCVANAVEVELKSRFPDAFIKSISFSDSIATEYEAANCAAVVWSMPVVKRTPRTAQFMCEKNLFAVEVVMELPFAFPVRDGEIAAAFSALIKLQANEKPSKGYLNHYEKAYYQETCADGRIWRDKGVPEEVDSDLVQLRPDHFFFPILFLAFCMLVAFLRSLWSGSLDKSGGDQSAEKGTYVQSAAVTIDQLPISDASSAPLTVKQLQTELSELKALLASSTSYRHGSHVSHNGAVPNSESTDNYGSTAQVESRPDDTRPDSGQSRYRPVSRLVRSAMLTDIQSQLEQLMASHASLVNEYSRDSSRGRRRVRSQEQDC